MLRCRPDAIRSGQAITALALEIRRDAPFAIGLSCSNSLRRELSLHQELLRFGIVRTGLIGFIGGYVCYGPVLVACPRFESLF